MVKLNTKEIKLLKLSASNSVQLIRSFSDAFKRLNIKGTIYTADIERYCASAIVADKHFVVPRSDSDEYFSFLKKIIKENSINVVLSERDDEIYLLAQNKKIFDELNCILLFSDLKAIELCRDKYQLFKFFACNKIPTPKTWNFNDLKEKNSIKYPLICKPRFGSGSRDIICASDFYFIEKGISNKELYIFQEIIDGTEYTIDVLIDLEGNVLSVIPRTRILKKGGESYVSITRKNQNLINLAIKICSLIKFKGHINIQCIMRENTPYFIEINPRFGGASQLAFKAGMDSPYRIIQMLQGKKVEPFIGDFEENLIMLRYTQDFYIKTK